MKTAAEIATQVLLDRIEAVRLSTPKVDPLVEAARLCQQQTGQSWPDAYANARAVAAARRFHEERRKRRHRDGFHFDCVWWECPDADGPEEDELPPLVAERAHLLSRLAEIEALTTRGAR